MKFIEKSQQNHICERFFNFFWTTSVLLLPRRQAQMQGPAIGSGNNGNRCARRRTASTVMGDHRGRLPFDAVHCSVVKFERRPDIATRNGAKADLTPSGPKA
jgi:hypothetical protein